MIAVVVLSSFSNTFSIREVNARTWSQQFLVVLKHACSIGMMELILSEIRL